VLASCFFICTVVVNAETVTVDVIVGFNGTPDPELLTSYGGKVLEVYSIIPAVHVVLPKNVIEQLTQNPKVVYVTENSKIQAAGTIRWAIENIGAPQAWSQSTGEGVKVAVLDSGVGPVNDLKVYGGYNFIDNNYDTRDVFGHGTLIAGIIAVSASSSLGVAGVAPNAEIYAVKVLNNEGVGTLNQAISGIQWAIDHGMQIISMSWNFIDNSYALKQAVDAAYSKGLLLVGAAGNAGEVMTGVGCPACYDSVIAVSAVTEDNLQLDESCCGEEIELTAPGELTYSIGIDNTTWAGTGTSYSTAYVTGTAALVWAKNPSLTNIQVRNILDITAVDLQPADGKDRDIFFGYGLVNASAAVFATPSNFEADFSWKPQTVFAGEITRFDASESFGGATGFTSYRWDFGDGTTIITTDAKVTEHVFASEGTFQVNLYVSDLFGFEDNLSQTVLVTKDTVPPVTQDNYDGKTHSSAFVITLSASDDLSGTAETYYRINDGPILTVTIDGQPQIKSEGTNKLEYWSEDHAGNQETHKIINDIIIDNTPSTKPETNHFLTIICVTSVSAITTASLIIWHRKNNKKTEV
jgi:subtilisin